MDFNETAHKYPSCELLKSFSESESKVKLITSVQIYVNAVISDSTVWQRGLGQLGLEMSTITSSILLQKPILTTPRVYRKHLPTNKWQKRFTFQVPQTMFERVYESAAVILFLLRFLLFTSFYASANNCCRLDRPLSINT